MVRLFKKHKQFSCVSSKGFSKRVRAEAVIEYMAMLVLVLAAFMVINKYALRAMMGRWKTVGDSFDVGRQFDPLITKRGAYDSFYSQRWYNQDCFEQSNCTCAGVDSSPITCGNCICLCVGSYDAQCDNFKIGVTKTPPAQPGPVCDWKTVCDPSGKICCDHDGCCEPDESPQICSSDCKS